MILYLTSSNSPATRNPKNLPCICHFNLVTANTLTDQEIFRLRDEVALSEGDDVSFYDFLDIKNNANQDEINKAYRKKSKLLHPDKVTRQFVADKSTGKDKKKTGKKPGVNVSKGPSQAEIDAAGKAASDRFTRLGLIAKILRGPGRERYDHFLNNGFPKWKGTGYYYARFRPGVGSVLIGLFIFVGGAGHWLVLYLNWRRHTEFVGRYVNHARNAAGNFTIQNIPGIDTPPASTPTTEEQDPMNAQPRNRRERRMQEKSMSKDKKMPPKVAKSVKSASASPAPTPPAGGRRKRVIAQNGKPLVVDEEGNVYLEQYDQEGELHEYLLDVSSPIPLSP